MIRKATMPEIMERLREIRALVINGTSYGDVVRYGTEKWNITARQIDKYLKRVHEEFLLEASKNYDRNYAQAVNRLEDYIRRAAKAGDRKAQLMGLRELHKIQGLHVARLDVTSGGEKIELVLDPSFFAPQITAESTEVEAVPCE